MWTATTIVARHPRATAKGTLTTDFWHYLSALVRKPGAFANAIPVRQAAFPAEAQAILDALEAAHPDARRSAHRASSRSAPWAPTSSPSAGGQPARPPWREAT